MPRLSLIIHSHEHYSSISLKESSSHGDPPTLGSDSYKYLKMEFGHKSLDFSVSLLSICSFIIVALYVVFDLIYRNKAMQHKNGEIKRDVLAKELLSREKCKKLSFPVQVSFKQRPGTSGLKINCSVGFF